MDLAGLVQGGHTFVAAEDRHASHGRPVVRQASVDLDAAKPALRPPTSDQATVSARGREPGDEAAVGAPMVACLTASTVGNGRTVEHVAKGLRDLLREESFAGLRDRSGARRIRRRRATADRNGEGQDDRSETNGGSVHAHRIVQPHRSATRRPAPGGRSLGGFDARMAAPSRCGTLRACPPPPAIRISASPSKTTTT